MEVWNEVAEATEASMVAGELVARIDGKHVSLGRKVGPQFTFTPAGLEVHERLASEAIVAAAKAAAEGAGEADELVEVVVPKLRAPRKPKAAAEPVVGDLTALLDDEADRELELALGDEVGTEESAG